MEVIMSEKRIDTTTSRTAEWTCMSRAISSLEKDERYKSNDYLAARLLPKYINTLIHVPCVRRYFTKVMAPGGMYEYVIARTKYIDNVFQTVLSDHFSQVLIMGAGFDTRSLRFQSSNHSTGIYELDVPVTQQAKIHQYTKRGLSIPESVHFVAIDFDKESLSEKLEEAGFARNLRSLFVMEGLLMYLQPESVDATFRVCSEFAGKGSEVVFDVIHASVARREGHFEYEEQAVKRVSGVGEQWQFGLDQEEIDDFLSAYGMEMIETCNAQQLEDRYFQGDDGKPVGHINATHYLVWAGKY
jgi:methyltransferase (TIGR00027 family)